MKNKVLVTGANGQLAKTVENKGKGLSESIEFCFVSKEDLDISNKEVVNAFFTNNQFDYCINCAAYTNVELAETEIEAAFKINAEGIKYVAENCRKYNIILIHISTDYVFDGSKSKPYTEGDDTNPLNVYGKSKLAGEAHIQDILTEYFIIRTSWLYSQFGKNFVKSIFNKLQNNESLKIVTSETGTPTSCNDLSEFIIYLIEQRITNFGIYHFSASGSTTWHGLALQIANEIGKEHLISKVDSFPMKAARPKYSVLNNKKAHGIIDKRFSWEDSVVKTVSELI